jgi:hypothetical protein
MANDVLSDRQIDILVAVAENAKDPAYRPLFAAALRELQQHRLAAVQAQPVSARPGVELCPACGKVANDVFGVCSHGFHAPKPTVCPVPCADGELRPCHAYCQRCGDEIERASVSHLRDETREPDTAGRVEPMHTGDDPIVDDWSSIRSSIETAIESAEALPRVGGEEASILENLSDTLTVIDRLDPIILAALQRARESAQGKTR